MIKEDGMDGACSLCERAEKITQISGQKTEQKRPPRRIMLE
jgi:hypothetical protein